MIKKLKDAIEPFRNKEKAVDKERVELVEKAEVYIYLKLSLDKEGSEANKDILRELKPVFEQVRDRMGERFWLSLMPPIRPRIDWREKGVGRRTKLNLRPGNIDQNEFAEDFFGNYESLIENEDVIFEFDQDVFKKLPDELKKKIKEGELEENGIERKRKDRYWIIFRPKDRGRLLEEYFLSRANKEDEGMIKTEIEIAKMFPQADKLFAELKRRFKKSPQLLALVRFELQNLKDAYDKAAEEGADDTKEAIKKSLENLIKVLEKSLKDKDESKVKGAIRKWFDENKGTILNLFGTSVLMWSAVFAFYLPVWIIEQGEAAARGAVKK